ncbi:hypothetical protein UPYG_G00066130 [Umbra pygmaea]|uniref:Uncharacterized protein n=1 Tax=Umbra pygmaea TaxID=75934 RepID=A0ABD0XE49_UMBPY
MHVSWLSKGWTRQAHGKFLRDTCEKTTMPQTTSNPSGLCLSPKTISDCKQKFCAGATGPAPERNLVSYCNGTLSPTSKTSLLPLPQPLPSPPDVEEDWDEVCALPPALTSSPILEENWEEDTYGFTPYGPEDVASMVLQELNLGHAPDPPQTASDFTPSTQHQAPIRWVRHIRHIVEEQFDDAEG